MDLPVPRRRRTTLVMALAFGLALGSAAAGREVLPNISNEPAGDPGDGVLRPADQVSLSETTFIRCDAATPDRTAPALSPQAAYVLVPVPAPAAQSGLLSFRLIRVDRDAIATGWRWSFGGRWQRAR